MTRARKSTRRFDGCWRTKPLEMLARVDAENLPASTDPDYSFNYISIDDVDRGRLLGYSTESFRCAPSRARRVVRAGDVLMSTVRPVLGGHLLFRDQVREPVCSTGFAVLRVNRDQCDAGFLFAHLFGPALGTEIRDVLVGSNYPAISSRDVKRLSVLCPPTVAEQRAVAGVLADVDSLIGWLEVLIAKTRDIKRAAAQELLTGRTRLPGFRGKWKTTRVGEIGIFRKGRRIRRDQLCDVGVPCVRYGELYTRYNNYVAELVSRVPTDVASGALPIMSGDLLFAGSGETAGEIGTCVAYVGGRIAYAGGDIIVVRAVGHDAMFLGHALNSAAAANQKVGIAQGDAIVHIRPDHLATVEVALPRPCEQRAVGKALSDMDAEIDGLERRLAKTRALKQGMMRQLLTGVIRLPIPEEEGVERLSREDIRP